MIDMKQALMQEVGSYDDSEWTGKIGAADVVLMAQPLTPADMTQISRKHPNFTSSPSLEGMIDLMIMKCKDSHGQLAFAKTNKSLLMRVGTDKIGEIFGELFGAQMEEYTEEDLDADVKK